MAGAIWGTYAFYHSPWWTRIGFAPDQPVLFSHRHHAGELRIDCRYCHSSVDRAAFAGLPATQTCLSCHSQIFTDTAMLRPVVASLRENRPMAWRSVTRLPNFVFFDHSIHIARGVACASCHGDVAHLALEEKLQKLDMRMCLTCHRHASAYGVTADHLLNCSTCHR
ncbi:MAG TPA: cytochrome c3 family protein [Opitutaceae bacterium]